jgi:small conductance mechanosensitive channel
MRMDRILTGVIEFVGDAPDFVWRWLVTSGVRLLLIVTLFFVGSYAVHALAAKLGRLLEGPSPFPERQKRAETLSGIVRGVAMTLLIVVSAMLVLQELGVALSPVLATAGIGGLAIAFGAQSLVRDVVAGFFILLEDQIRVGDVVEVEGQGGLVESVGLRILTLRGLDGSVHIIPNGTIQKVKNMTKGFSYALLDVGVSYREDIDEVIDVLTQVAAGLRDDPEFGPDIIEDPEVLGVDDLADSAVVIKMRLKTQPIKQWGVAREMRRRIKKAFDARGFEIPFPRRTVHINGPTT